jgi:murein hydrolase activator
MNKIFKILGLVVLFISFYDSVILCQNRAYYEKLKLKNKENIGYSKKLLGELKSTSENNLDKLLITREQINKQKEILSIVNRELALIDNEIVNDNNRAEELKKESETVKNEYSKLILYSYKNLNLQKRMIFVFSAQSFNSAYRRMIYLKSLSDYRKSRFIQIEENIKEKDSVLNLLKEKKSSKLNLQNEKKSLVDSLVIREKQLNNFLALNKNEISKIKNIVESENKKREISKVSVNNQIQKVEEEKEEIVPNKNVKLDGNITAKFEAKKKWHIWPLSKFVILHHFGDYPHPVFNNVMVKNDGVELGTSAGSNVHAIFEGIVINIVQIPGDGSSVIIKHGNYYSVYSKLYYLLIKQGDVVTTGQVIAKMGKNDKVVKMNFQLWKGKERLNPEIWLKRQ